MRSILKRCREVDGLAIGIAVLLIGWLAWRWLRSPAGRAWWQTRVLALPVEAPCSTNMS